MDLGRAAVSGLFRRDRRVVRRRELGDRPLAHRPARRGTARRAGRRDPQMPALRISTATGLGESVDGYVIDRPMSPRAAIEPLAAAYAFDAVEVAGTLTFRLRGGDPVAEIAEDALVLPERRAPVRLVRAQETELPREVSIAFTDSGSDYRAPQCVRAASLAEPPARATPISPW